MGRSKISTGSRRERRGAALAGVALAAVVGLGAVSGFVEVAGAGRRQVMGALFGASVAATAGSAANAELFEPGVPGAGIGNNPQTRLPNQKIDVQAMIKQVPGGNLGRIMNIRDQCFEADEKGFIARISTSSVVVWDPDAPCGAGKAFIHAAGQGEWSPMTASAGPTRHTYHAGTFIDGNIVGEFKFKIGQCAELPKADDFSDEITWEVASAPRGGKCS